MTDDSTAPDQLDDDPSEDTGDEQGTDTAANTRQAQPDEEVIPASRYKSLQAEYTRTKQRERDLENRILAAQQQPAVNDPTDPLAPERAQIERDRAQLRAEREWAEILRTKPPETIAAYEVYQRNAALDPSPQGYVTAFEEGIREFASRIAAAAAAEEPTPARTPARDNRVDTSRSDSPDPDAINDRIARAKANHDVNDHVRALLGLPAKRRG